MEDFFERMATDRVPGVDAYDASIIARLLRDEAHRANMVFYAEGGWSNLDGWTAWCHQMRPDGLTNVGYAVRLKMLADMFDARAELATELDAAASA